MHGAPTELVRRARRNAAEEVEHARATRALAEGLGGRVPEVAHERRPIRSLDELALDNAREGCVRETYGALVAAHQSTHGCDPVHRRVFARIARDEAGHGLFSVVLADWSAPLVGRRVIEDARAEAKHAMRLSLGDEPHRELLALGMPNAERANDLLAVLPGYSASVAKSPEPE